MINDPEVDIVYIATPHNLHYRFIMDALHANKHVFCEKAITVNAQQLEGSRCLSKKKRIW